MGINLPRPKGYENYEFPHIIQKPWGLERWIELFYDEKTGRGYCMKYLFIRRGTRTSKQIHKIKTETNFLLMGKADIFIENEIGKIEKKVMEAGDERKDTWTIPAGRIHRSYALTDIHLIETSTYDVDDVIRIKDDTGRGNGRIESEWEDHQ